MEIKHYARTELDFDPKGLPFSWTSPPVQHALNYNTGNSLEHHPRIDCLKIDWCCPGLTPWTSDTATLLARKFCMEHERGGFPAIRRNLKQDRIDSMFVKYILRMKRHYIREVEEFDPLDHFRRLVEELDPLDYFQRLVEGYTISECECDCNKDEEENEPREKEGIVEDQSESEGDVEKEENEDL
jgi:hypothetical protein